MTIILAEDASYLCHDFPFYRCSLYFQLLLMGK